MTIDHMTKVWNQSIKQRPAVQTDNGSLATHHTSKLSPVEGQLTKAYFIIILAFTKEKKGISLSTLTNDAKKMFC